MRLELELAFRFLRRRSGILLRGTALAALTGVTISTAALVITLALMNGYRSAIARALQRGNAHLVGFAPRPLTLQRADDLARHMADVGGVRRASPVTYLSGLVEDPDEPASPLPVVIKAVGRPPAYTGLAAWPEGELVPAVVGEELASAIRLAVGEEAVVRLPPRPASWTLPSLRIHCVGTFRLAFSEFDERWIIVPLASLLGALPLAGAAGVEVELEDPLAVEAVREPLEEAAPELLFNDWREMNRPLFAALTWQIRSLFLVLSLVVAVASFQVSSALVVLAIDKRRSTGMLQALGASPARVRRVLVMAGSMLGGTGVVTGVALGSIASLLASELRLVRFPRGLARVYMVDHIPFAVDGTHLLTVAGVCGLLVVLASLWPAWRASRQDPVAALKAV